MDEKSTDLFPVFYVEKDEDSRYRASIVLNMIDCHLTDKEPTDGDFGDVLVLAPCPSEGKYTEMMARLGGALHENSIVYTFPGFDPRDWDQLASFAVNTIQASTPKKFFPTKRSAMRFLWTGLAEIAKSKEIAKKYRSYNYYDGKKKNDYTEIDGLWKRLVGIGRTRKGNVRRLDEQRKYEEASHLLTPLVVDKRINDEKSEVSAVCVLNGGDKIAKNDKRSGETIDRKETRSSEGMSSKDIIDVHNSREDDLREDKKADLQNKNAPVPYVDGTSTSEYAEIFAGDSSDDNVLLPEFIDRVKALKMKRGQSNREQ